MQLAATKPSVYTSISLPGEISRIVGNEWRSLPASTKQTWEERAARCNEETSARLAEEMRELSSHVSVTLAYWDMDTYVILYMKRLQKRLNSVFNF